MMMSSPPWDTIIFVFFRHDHDIRGIIRSLTICLNWLFPCPNGNKRKTGHSDIQFTTNTPLEPLLLCMRLYYVLLRNTCNTLGPLLRVVVALWTLCSDSADTFSHSPMNPANLLKTSETTTRYTTNPHWTTTQHLIAKRLHTRAYLRRSSTKYIYSHLIFTLLVTTKHLCIITFRSEDKKTQSVAFSAWHTLIYRKLFASRATLLWRKRQQEKKTVPQFHKFNPSLGKLETHLTTMVLCFPTRCSSSSHSHHHHRFPDTHTHTCVELNKIHTRTHRSSGKFSHTFSLSYTQ